MLYPYSKIDLDQSGERAFSLSLPDLNMIVSDGDISRNAEYDLVLEDIENSEGVFSVYPTRGTRNTPVTIRVADPSRYVSQFTIYFC